MGGKARVFNGPSSFANAGRPGDPRDDGLARAIESCASGFLTRCLQSPVERSHRVPDGGASLQKPHASFSTSVTSGDMIRVAFPLSLSAVQAWDGSMPTLPMAVPSRPNGAPIAGVYVP